VILFALELWKGMTLAHGEVPLQADLAQKYWDVANAIVAFSVLQMLAFLYSLGKNDFRQQVASVLGPVITGSPSSLSILQRE
jgi:hypothetical protein